MANNRGFSFFGMVGGAMALLKLKERWDEYKQVPTQEDGRIALAAGGEYRDEEGVGLLPQVVEVNVHRRTTPKKGCCVCCGLDCSLFWKAFGLVVGIFFAWNAFRLIRWAVTPSPTGLESMPAFSTSLGCMSAPYIYNSSHLVVSAPVGTKEAEHAFDVRGAAVGTITIAQGKAGSDTIRYEMTIRATERALLDSIIIQRPSVEPDGTISNSRILLATPPALGSSSCMRYDITVFVPPNLKKLHIASHAVSHVQFDTESKVQLDYLYVTLYSMHTDNIILPHDNLRANHLALEVYRGWIVGEAAIVNSTSITTQRGDGVANVKIVPTVPIDLDVPETAYLRTTTGAGRTDIFYISPKSTPHRPINSVHMSSRNADMYITYREAEFRGLINLDARSFTASGLSSLGGGPSQGHNEEPEAGGLVLPNMIRDEEKFTHFHGDRSGFDRMLVQTRGWAGVYL